MLTDERPLIELATVTDLPLLSESTTAPDPQTVYGAWWARWGPIAPVLIEHGVPAWLVMGYQECCAIMRSEYSFSRDPRNWRWNQENLLPEGAGIRAFSPPEPRAGSYHHDGETRRRLRQALDDAIADLPDAQIKAATRLVCTEAIARFDAPGPVDLIADYATPVSFLATAAMLGIEGDAAMQLMRDSEIIARHQPGGLEARARIGATLMGHVRASRERFGRDLTSSLVRHPNMRSDAEVVDSAAVPLHAASMFLGAWIGRALHLELADAAFRARWSGGRLGLDDALDQVLWRDTPVANSCAPRYAMHDTVLDGNKAVRRGDALVLALSAANHDPAVHSSDPWDEVGNRSHLAWGTGPHTCPAPAQARLVTRTAIDVLLQQVDLTLMVPADQVEWAPTPWVRQPRRLPAEASLPVLHGHQVPILGDNRDTWTTRPAPSSQARPGPAGHPGNLDGTGDQVPWLEDTPPPTPTTPARGSTAPEAETPGVPSWSDLLHRST
ncbi:cytochrome P450 [Myceligenerans crystallogenes]|uniref:Cytochrome P450 n=1 Tax=Myceligenerans crystallogenes TaxID=316335 RepID=A0ABN2NLA0_9MICO